jgi:hypothetical protein
VFQRSSRNAERHIGINARARGIVNQKDRARIARSALKRLQASGNRC